MPEIHANVIRSVASRAVRVEAGFEQLRYNKRLGGVAITDVVSRPSCTLRIVVEERKLRHLSSLLAPDWAKFQQQPVEYLRRKHQRCSPRAVQVARCHAPPCSM